MKSFQITDHVGQIVVELPKASEVFKTFGIDFCCGGNRPLGDVVKELGISEEVVLKELEKALEAARKEEDEVDFTQMSKTDLADYVVRTHHGYLRRNLPEIDAYLNKILRVHGKHHQELFTVHRLFGLLKMDLEEHIVKEEHTLFPNIQAYDFNQDQEAFKRVQVELKETTEEHDAAGDLIKELRKVTDGFTTPKDGCSTFALTYRKLVELESDLFQHIHLENNILFKDFE